MYLIEESIEALQKFFEQYPKREEIEEALIEDAKGLEESSTWINYENCRRLENTIMQYRVGTPVEFVQELKNLWTDYESLSDDEFIKMFVVSAFRQNIGSEKKKGTEQTDITIPSFIYNF